MNADRSSVSTVLMISHARWPRGSQSRMSGGRRNTWSESDRMKLNPTTIIFSYRHKTYNAPRVSSRFRWPPAREVEPSWHRPPAATVAADASRSRPPAYLTAQDPELCDSLGGVVGVEERAGSLPQI